jgi:hypothetical protein
VGLLWGSGVIRLVLQYIRAPPILSIVRIASQHREDQLIRLKLGIDIGISDFEGRSGGGTRKQLQTWKIGHVRGTTAVKLGISGGCGICSTGDDRGWSEYRSRLMIEFECSKLSELAMRQEIK